MQRREFLGTLAAAGLATALPAGGQEARIQRNGRIKQGLWRNNFGEATTLTFDDMCREAARLGAYGFDLIGPENWPTLRRHGLEPLLVGTGGVDFENGIIHPEVHDQIETTLRPYIDMCAENGVRRIITIGGQRRGMPYDAAADNAVAFLNRIKGQLEERNVTIAIENMNNRLNDPRFGREDQVFGHWAWGVGVCERVDSQNVKLVCDLYHLQIMDGDLARYIRDTSRWIAHFHVAGVPTRNEIDFTQEINYRYVAEVIADLDYEGFVSHEWR
ncbi:MAG TPA: TIM barrel protein, partial [Gammaproteobacteria bacterium]